MCQHRMLDLAGSELCEPLSRFFLCQTQNHVYYVHPFLVRQFLQFHALCFLPSAHPAEVAVLLALLLRCEIVRQLSHCYYCLMFHLPVRSSQRTGHRTNQAAVPAAKVLLFSLISAYFQWFLLFLLTFAPAPLSRSRVHGTR